jgi:hypothetical protein
VAKGLSLCSSRDTLYFIATIDVYFFVLLFGNVLNERGQFKSLLPDPRASINNPKLLCGEKGENG